MGRTARGARSRLVGLIAVGALALLLSCSDDDPGSASSEETTTTVLAHGTSTTLDFGDLDLVVPVGYQPVPLPKLGFGLAVPDGWQVSLVTDDALRRLENAQLADPAFLDSARQAGASGAILYAAGVSPDLHVTDLKLDVQEKEGAGLAAAHDAADDVAARSEIIDPKISEFDDAASPAIRVRFRLKGPGGPDAPATTEASQYFFSGNDQLWSLLIISEDAATHDAQADALAATFVLTPA
jgi:hypothetical protein